MKWDVGQRVQGLLFNFVRTIQNGLPLVLPKVSAVDDRSPRIKFLDTCRALVSEATLAEWLIRQGKVDLSQWSCAGTKSVADLFLELSRGESELRSDGCRVVRVAKVRIIHGDFELINTLQARPSPAPPVRRHTHILPAPSSASATLRAIAKCAHRRLAV